MVAMLLLVQGDLLDLDVLEDVRLPTRLRNALAAAMGTGGCIVLERRYAEFLRGEDNPLVARVAGLPADLAPGFLASAGPGLDDIAGRRLRGGLRVLAKSRDPGFERVDPSLGGGQLFAQLRLAGDEHRVLLAQPRAGLAKQRDGDHG